MLLTNSNNFKSYKTSLKLDLSGKKQQESRKNLKMKNTEKKPLMDLTETIQVLINYQKMDFKVKIKSKSREPINSQDKILTIILWSPDNEQGNTSIKEINSKTKIKNLKINSNLKSNKICKSSNIL